MGSRYDNIPSNTGKAVFVPAQPIITTNGKTGEPTLSICIPTWKDDARALLAGLAKQHGIGACEVLIYDDGSGDRDMTASIQTSLDLIDAHATLITQPENYGRAFARNQLIKAAKADWLLLLDADMLPDSDSFIAAYTNAINASSEPALVAGGFSLDQVEPTRQQRLHAAQSLTSECVPAHIRAREPGLHVFTSNILVHRNVLASVQFDEGYTGWGWEDIDWGLRVAEKFPVKHIENTATHLGLDSDANLVSKYGTSAENFARLARQHPDAVSKMKLYRMARRFQNIPARAAIKTITRSFASLNHALIPIKLRLLSLKLFRAVTYSEVLK